MDLPTAQHGLTSEMNPLVDFVGEQSAFEDIERFSHLPSLVLGRVPPSQGLQIKFLELAFVLKPFTVVVIAQLGSQSKEAQVLLLGGSHLVWDLSFLLCRSLSILLHSLPSKSDGF